MAGSLVFAGLVWGSILAVMGAFSYVTWQLVAA